MISTILYQSYISLILNSYFKPESIPLVNSLNDIIINKNIKICHHHNLNLVDILPRQIYELISSKILSFNRDNKKCFRDLSMGKSVYIFNTNIFKKVYKYFNNIVVLNNKYYPIYYAWIIRINDTLIYKHLIKRYIFIYQLE